MDIKLLRTDLNLFYFERKCCTNSVILLSDVTGKIYVQLFERVCTVLNISFRQTLSKENKINWDERKLMSDNFLLHCNKYTHTRR